MAWAARDVRRAAGSAVAGLVGGHAYDVVRLVSDLGRALAFAAGAKGGRVRVRIYSLAKDLKIDSKDLVDLCTKAGIPGKGSALASLEDHEVTKLRTFMEG